MKYFSKLNVEILLDFMYICTDLQTNSVIFSDFDSFGKKID
jgi:hypothetical protein